MYVISRGGFYANINFQQLEGNSNYSSKRITKSSVNHEDRDFGIEREKVNQYDLEMIIIIRRRRIVYLLKQILQIHEVYEIRYQNGIHENEEQYHVDLRSN